MAVIYGFIVTFAFLSSQVRSDVNAIIKNHPLCHTKDLKILGSFVLSNMLNILVLDGNAKQTLVYQIPDENIKNLYAKIVIDKRVRTTNLLDEWGYDPIKHNKIPINVFALTGSRREETVITFMYDSKIQNAESVSSIERVPFKSYQQNGTFNSIILNKEFQGLHFYKSNNMQYWIVRTVKYFNDELWFDNQISAVAITDSDDLVYKKFQLERNQKFAQWTEINGFINSVFIFLFAEQNVYVYIDPYIGAQGDIEITYKFRRLSYDELFWCSTVVPGVLIEPLNNVKESNNKPKVYTIYMLFGLHFLVAFIMLVFIIKMNILDSEKDFNPIQVKKQSKTRSRTKSGGHQTSPKLVQNENEEIKPQIETQFNV